MKKRLLSILLTCCMVLTLLPMAAYAEDGDAAPAEQQEEVIPEADPEQPEEQPEEQPAAEEKETQEEQEAQSEGEPVVLNDEDETVIELMPSNISNYMSSGLTDGSYKLGDDVTIESGSLEVKGTVTLDLNGHTLLFKKPEQFEASKWVSAGIRVYNSDSSENAAKYALTLCDTSKTKTGKLDVWGESMQKWGEGLFVGQNGELTMTGGTITDSSGINPWGIGIGIIEGRVTMTGGKIENQTRCGVTLAGGTFEMSGDAVISNCGSSNFGGGIWIGGGTFTMTGGTIENCKATKGGGVYVGVDTFDMSDGSIENCTAMTTDSTMAMGGGVYVANKGTFNMSGGSIVGCTASADEEGRAFGGGIRNDGRTTLSGTAQIRNCQATNSGGGISDGGTLDNPSTLNISGNVKITGCKANGTSDAMIVMYGTISGGKFDGTVTNNGTITGGTFTGEVTNKGTITGGTFTGEVTNKGTITGGTFNGGITGTPAIVTGSGIEEDPYQIGTATGLKWFRDKVNDAKTEEETKICAELTADIDLNNEEWTPIGNAVNYLDYQKAYSGIFDGKGHTISGLKLTGNFEFAGLFGLISGATIQDISISGSMAGSYHNFGSIAGTAAENSTIKNCSSHCNVTNTISGGYIGGVVGVVSPTATIIDCYNTGSINWDDSPSDNNRITGGIAGRNAGTICNCYNVGSVSCNEQKWLGSIAGENMNTANSKGIVENCYFLSNTADIPATGAGGGSVDEATGPKSAAEFADGTVLNLLINDRAESDHPWVAECRYVDAAGKTLPVFEWQKHTHTWGAWISNGDGTKTRTCPCGASETVSNSSGSGGSSHHHYYTIKAAAGNGGSISPADKVSVREGRNQTFTITPDTGYAVSDVKIDGKSIGAVESYTFEKVGGSHTIEVVFSKIESTPQDDTFVDVTTGSYYKDAVDWAVENGITKGTDATHFSPDGICTRAQAVAFLWRAAGSPKPETDTMPFADVPADSYYYNAVLWAVENGIAKGTGDTTFSPDMTCTRAQIVSFLWRAAKSPAADAENPFTDVSADAYYADAVLWAVKEGITKGTTGTTFSPDADCTRAQIVTFLWHCRK